MDDLTRHRCIVYGGSPAVHLPVVTTAIIERLRANYRCLYLNSPPMVAGLRSQIAAAGIDVVDAVARGALVLSSEQDHLVNGEFDSDAMLAKLARALRQALSDGYSGLMASGDMLWELGGERNLAKLLAYEIDLESLLETEPALCGICQYHRDILPASAAQVALFTHQSVYRNETLARLNPHYRQLATLRSEPDHAELHVSEMLERLG